MILSDSMHQDSPAATPPEAADDWRPAPPCQEAPSLLVFSGGRLSLKREEELNEMLTRKFREFFP